MLSQSTRPLGQVSKNAQNLNHQDQPPQSVQPFQGVKFRSMQIVRPQYNATEFKKHCLYFIVDETLSIGDRKWISSINKKYTGMVYEDWKSAYPVIGSTTKRNQKEQESDKIFIVVEGYEKEIERELKLNPGLRVILWSKQEDVSKYRQTKISFISGYASEIQAYLNEHKSQLFLNK